MTTDNNEIANKIFERLDAIGSQVMTTAPMVWEKMVLLTQVESIAYLGVGFGVSCPSFGKPFHDL